MGYFHPMANTRRRTSYYVVDFGDGAVDQPTLAAAIELAQEAIDQGERGVATVFRGGSGANSPSYAIWRDENDAIHETRDRKTARRVFQRWVASPDRREPEPREPPELAQLRAVIRRFIDNDRYEEAAEALDVVSDANESRGLELEAARD